MNIIQSRIQALQAELVAARAEVAEHGGTWEAANRSANRALADAVDHDQAAQAAKLFGRIPTPRSRRHERLAREAREARRRYEQEAVDAAPASHAAHSRVHSLERRLAEARERERRGQEIVAEMESTRAIQDDVSAGSLTEEAHDGGREDIWAGYEQQETERPLERDDDLFGGEEVETAREPSIWDTDTDTSSDDDGGYAEAESDAIDDQLTVRSLDLSVDAGTRTYEQVYTPDGAIRQEMVRERDEPEQAQEQVAEVSAPEPEPEQPTQPQPPSRGGFEIDSF